MQNVSPVGVAGLGIMGTAFVTNLQRHGHPVVAWNRTSKAANSLGPGLRHAGSPRELAEQSDPILVIVRDPAAVSGVLHGPEGALSGDVTGKTFIQMSTIDYASTLRLADEVQRHGARFLDCPVSGSKPLADTGQVIVLAGGAVEDVEKWSWTFDAISRRVVHAGPIGMGTALKLCINLMVAQMTTAICESVALSGIFNLDPAKIFDVLQESPALNCGYYSAKRNPLLKGDYQPQFSLSNVTKDVRFIDDAAATAGLVLPVTRAVRSLMEKGMDAGLGEDDLVGLIRVLR